MLLQSASTTHHIWSNIGRRRTWLPTEKMQDEGALTAAAASRRRSPSICHRSRAATTSTRPAGGGGTPSRRMSCSAGVDVTEKLAVDDGGGETSLVVIWAASSADCTALPAVDVSARERLSMTATTASAAQRRERLPRQRLSDVVRTGISHACIHTCNTVFHSAVSPWPWPYRALTVECKLIY